MRSLSFFRALTDNSFYSTDKVCPAYIFLLYLLYFQVPIDPYLVHFLPTYTTRCVVVSQVSLFLSIFFATCMNTETT